MSAAAAKDSDLGFWESSSGSQNNRFVLRVRPCDVSFRSAFQSSPHYSAGVFTSTRRLGPDGSASDPTSPAELRSSRS